MLLSTSTDNGIDVSILPPLDNGGSAVTQYRVEWDVLGAEAWDLDATSPYISNAGKSLLYSPYAVQRIHSSASTYSLAGYFTIGFGNYNSDPVKVDATAAELATILERVPTVGNVQVTRSESNNQQGYSWSVTFLNSGWWIVNNFYQVPQMTLVKRKNHMYQGSGFNIVVIFVEQLGNVEQMHADVSNLYISDAQSNVLVYYHELVTGIQPVMQSRYFGSQIVAVNASMEKAVFKYTIPNLSQGLNYHVRVAAWNGVGAGTAVRSAAPSSEVPPR